MSGLIVLVGIPGCGKSTWAWDQFQADADSDDIRVISTDDIREQLAGDGDTNGTREQFWAMPDPPQKLVFELYHAWLFDGLRDGRTMIADATNLHGYARDRLRQIAFLTGAVCEVRCWTNATAARERNRRRENQSEIVPDEVMAKMEVQLSAAIVSLTNGFEQFDDVKWVAE